jgi:hypothetical protein
MGDSTSRPAAAHQAYYSVHKSGFVCACALGNDHTKTGESRKVYCQGTGEESFADDKNRNHLGIEICSTRKGQSSRSVSEVLGRGLAVRLARLAPWFPLQFPSNASDPVNTRTSAAL